VPLHDALPIFAEVSNLAVNHVLMRSINTSLVTLLPVLALLVIGVGLLGAGTLKDLALVMSVGTVAGTASSVLLATPLLVDFKMRHPEYQEHERKVLARRAQTEQRKAERATVTVDDEELEGELRNEKAYAAASSVPGRTLKRIHQQRAAGRPTGKRAARGSGRPTGKATGQRRRAAERATLVTRQPAPERREEVRASQGLDSSAGTSAVARTPGSGRPATPSATTRVRARLARRITAQRAASVKQVLEPLVAVHRELHPNADLALLQRAYDVA